MHLRRPCYAVFQQLQKLQRACEGMPQEHSSHAAENAGRTACYAAVARLECPHFSICIKLPFIIQAQILHINVARKGHPVCAKKLHVDALM